MTGAGGEVRSIEINSLSPIVTHFTLFPLLLALANAVASIDYKNQACKQ